MQRNRIYLIRCAQTSYYKIGRGEGPQRVSQLQIGCPYELQLIIDVVVNEVVRVERILQTVFSDKRVRGEWFELTKAEVAKVALILQENEERDDG